MEHAQRDQEPSMRALQMDLGQVTVELAWEQILSQVALKGLGQLSQPSGTTSSSGPWWTMSGRKLWVLEATGNGKLPIDPAHMLMSCVSQVMLLSCTMTALLRSLGILPMIRACWMSHLLKLGTNLSILEDFGHVKRNAMEHHP